MWRADTYYRSVEQAFPSKNAPVGRWLPARLGDGDYSYWKTEREAKDALIEVLTAELKDLQESIDALAKEV